VGWERVVEQVEFREELIRLGQQPGTNIRELCRRFQISPKTYYKWRRRFQERGQAGLENESRKPKQCRRRSEPRVEQAVMDLRQKYPQWGARKIEVLLRRETGDAPARSTIHGILKRNGCIDELESVKHRPWQRFEHAAPNQLWQMDFKGWSRKESGYRCDPLSVVDDHSRYAICLRACENQKTETVRQQLTTVFRQYGLPEQMVMDNGSPWGYDGERRHTPLTVWLMQLGVRVSHTRPYHPQTQGKVERFHRTLQAELLQGKSFHDRHAVQQALDRWREFYNLHRPHQALDMAVPASRYQISRRTFPETVSPPQYNSTDIVRTVDVKGHIRYQRRRFLISKGFRGYPVALRQSETDGMFDVYFYSYKVAQLDLRRPC
jgi:transposase InsO family protein